MIGDDNLSNLNNSTVDLQDVLDAVNIIKAEVDIQTDLINQIKIVLPSEYIVFIESNAEESLAYAELDGVKYTSSAKLTVTPNSTILLYHRCTHPNMRPYMIINNEDVYTNDYLTEYTVDSDCAIRFVKTHAGTYEGSIRYSGTPCILTNVPKSSIISFTIGGVPYYAEDGMTWTTWCDSRYNYMPGYTESWWASESGVSYADDFISHDGSNYVVGSDVIIGGHTYTTLFNNEQVQ